MRKSARYGRWLAAGLVALSAAAGLVFGRSGALVDWRAVRAVALESDDWGLCGFVPDQAALVGFDPSTVHPGSFPPVYWGSTLEDSAAVASLAAVLARARGADGLPAIMQPNYILSSLAWQAQPVGPGADSWVVRNLPQLPPAYQRPGLWTAVRAATAEGVWQPEFHGRWHYDPARRRAAAVSTPGAREALRRQIMLFPGSERAWELGPWRSDAELAAELEVSLGVFAALFGRQPRSVIAPDYVWDDRCERIWLSHGLRTIQAKRGQRQSHWQGLPGRARKLADRIWARQTRPDRVYLERNALFEPVQSADPSVVVRDCLRAVRDAWRQGAPAVVETHRINFVNLDSGVPRTGRLALDRLLQDLSGDAGRPPLYLVDSELADLQRRGVSWCERGDRLVLRNHTRSRRIVVVPQAHPVLVSLGPREMTTLSQ